MAVNFDYNTEQVQKCGGNDCFDIVKSSQTYTVPCVKSVREPYTVEVPKTKAITVNKKVPYIDYETQNEQVPYQYMDRRTVTRNVPTCRTVPVFKRVCTSVPVRRRGLGFGRRTYVKKMCPRTVYVNQKSCAQRRFCQSIPRTGWRTVQKSVPVKKFRDETEIKYMTEKVPEVRYRTRTVTKMVNKTVPVYNVVKKPETATQQQDVLVRTIPAPNEPTVLPPLTIQNGPAITYATPIPGAVSPVIVPGNVVQDFQRIDRNNDGMLSYNEMAFDIADANKDGALDINEYKAGYGTHNVNYVNSVGANVHAMSGVGAIGHAISGVANGTEVVNNGGQRCITNDSGIRVE